MKIHQLLVLAFFIFSCDQAPMQFDLLITNASIVDVSGGEIYEGRFIGLRGDSIAAVGEMRNIQKFAAKMVVDAEARFIMPGLWDNHVHFRGGDSLIQENRELLPLFLAHGVTSVRDAGGDMSPSLFEWEKQIKNGVLQGPEIFTSGPKLDGPSPAWAGSIPLNGPEEVNSAIDSLQSIGADYVKTYDGSLSPEVFYEIIREAEARRLKVTGHMPLSTDLYEALELGLDGMEHLYYFLPASSTVGDSIRDLNMGYRALSVLVDTYDESLARKVMEKAGESGFYATPTLHIGQVLQDLREEDHSSDSLLNYIGLGIRKTYDRRERSAKNRSDEGQIAYERMREVFKKMVLPAHESGITLLAGSDCGASNSYVYPGASLHSELEQLVSVGLTPQEALATSIINGPKFFGLEDQYGAVEVGKKANLIILDLNPLENISHTREVSFVIQGEKVFDKEMLLDMLK